MKKKNKFLMEILKSSKIKIIAMMVFIVMAFNLFAPTAFAISENIANTEQTTADTETTDSTTVETTTDQTQPPTIIGEDESMREANVKRFWLDNGTELAAIYPEPVHYLQDGKYIDIDNSLTDAIDDTSDQVLKNKANSFNVELVKQTNPNKLASIKSKDYKINWSLMNANKVRATQDLQTPRLPEENGQYKDSQKLNLKNITSSVTYKDILNNVDIQYVVQASKVKENIILNNSDAVNQTIQFNLNVGNKLKASLNEQKQVIIYETSIDKPVYVMDAPFMCDKNQEISGDIDVKLDIASQAGVYTLTITPSKTWLEDPERAYPVTIDPTISTPSDRDKIQDAYIYSTDSTNTSNGVAQILRIGSHCFTSFGSAMRSLVKFTLPTLNSGDQVIGAYMSLFTYPDGSTSRNLEIDAYRVTQDWTETNVHWSTMNNKYDNSKIIDAVTHTPKANTMVEHKFNLTSLVKDWYITGNNYGVMLKENTETIASGLYDAYFVSSDTSTTYTGQRPAVEIVYRNQTGLEGYLSYHTQTAGRAGTINTNDYNGNLVLTHADVATPGNRLPVGISHVYNSNNKGVASKYGTGFQLNISTTITLKTIPVNGVNQNFAVYTDEDGTAHYFLQQGTTSTYVDEDNSGLTLTLSNNIFTMTDKDGNKQTFEKRGTSVAWGLTKIIDTSGNTDTITFASTSPNDFVITGVADPSGATLTLTYDANGRLSTIKDVAGRVTTYAYDSSGNLTTITYPDGKASTYTYSGGLLTSAKNYDGAHIDYTYYTANVARVNTIKEYSKANELGNSLTIAYAYNVTTFTDNRGYISNITFNDCGQAVSTADFGTGTQDINNAYGQNFQYGSSGGEKNNITQVGKLTKTKDMPNNLIQNPGFDNGLTNWTKNANCTTTEDVVSDNGNNVIRIQGDITLDKSVKQTIKNTGKKGDIYSLSLWHKSNGAVKSNGSPRIMVRFADSTGAYTAQNNQINAGSNAWEYSSYQYIADRDYVEIQILLIYHYNINTIYYDNLSLVKDEGGNSYTYDNNGNLVNSQDNAKQNSNFSYNGNNQLISEINPKGGQFGYYYDTTIKDRLLSATNTSGQKYSFTYDSVGNATSSKVESTTAIESGATYRIKTKFGLYLQAMGTANGSEIQQQALNTGITAQQWDVIDVGNGNYKIRANGTTSVMDVAGAATANGTKVQVYTDNGTSAQQYRITPVGDGSFSLKTAIANYASSVDVTSGSSAAGTKIQEYVTNNTVSQQFYFEKVNGVALSPAYMQTSAAYSSDGRYQTSSTDVAGNTTTTAYNANTGTVASVTDPNGGKANYTYDSMDRLTNVSQSDGTKTYSNGYTYSNDDLKTINHNGTTYTFNYDNFGNTSSVAVGSQNLITNTYEGNNGKLTNATYGNGQTVSYTYDRFYRMITQSKAQGIFQYNYDNRGNLAYTQDPTGAREYYYYDLADRMTKFSNAGGISGSYTYDANSNLNTKTFDLNGGNLNKITYNMDKDNRLTSQTFDSTTQALTYDGLSRPTSVKTTAGSASYTTNYGYVNTATANKTTPLIASVTNGANPALNYTYDANGNIATISNGSTLQQKFYYDGLNQLIREDNVALNKSIVYNYDIGGNLTSKVEYPYTTGTTLGTATKTTPYVYGNSGWTDQLTSFDGKAITYDAIR